MSKDETFKKPRQHIENFNFGYDTAVVFDDMLNRSVPFYSEIQRMIGELSADFAVPHTNLYDLGCSTGTTLCFLDHLLNEHMTFYGLDSSIDMLEQAQKKLAGAVLKHPFELVLKNLEQGAEISNSSVTILNLTMQFVRPIYRDRLLSDIANGTIEGGCLILVEKVIHPNPTLNRLFIKHYYDLKKRNGYSDLEISQKREALENVLVPYNVEENMKMLKRCGFSTTEVFFRWYNFCGILAVK